MSLGHWLLVAVGLVEALVVLGILVVVGKALVAYRQHDSRPMLLLGVGLFLLLVVPPGVELVGEALLEESWAPFRLDQSVATIGALLLTKELIRLAGLAALLGSLYVRE